MMFATNSVMAWIGLGVGVASIAMFFYRGHSHLGMFFTVPVAVLGAIVGGLLGHQAGIPIKSYWIFLPATLGAAVFAAAYDTVALVLERRRAHVYVPWRRQRL